MRTKTLKSLVYFFMAATLLFGCRNVESSQQIYVTDMADGRIFQRDKNGQYDLAITGGTNNVAGAIEARIVEADTENEVVAWTVIDNDASNGRFSGTLKGIPQGGWYNIQVRPSNNHSITATGSTKFGIGVLILTAGQSHMDLWYEAFLLVPEEWEAFGEVAVNPLTRMYRHEQVLQQGPKWTGWQPVTGVGARIFANKLQEALKVPVGLLDYAVGGSALWQKNTTEVKPNIIRLLISGYGWWLPDDSGKFPEQNNYSVLKAGLDSIDNKVEAALWIQGDTDAGSGESTDYYKKGLAELYSQLRSDTKTPDLPIFTSLLPRMGHLKLDLFLGLLNLDYPPNGDQERHNIRKAQEQSVHEDPYSFLGATTVDLPLVMDNVHHNPLGQQIQAERMAQAVLHILLDSGDYTYHRGPKIEGVEIVDASTLDVHIKHHGGNDFSPNTDIKGFEVLLGESSATPTKAFRYDADTIRLKIDYNTDNVTGVRYLFGVNPDDADLQSYVDEYVHDNSKMQLPLEGGTLGLP
ncbi:MAG: sialate O-acetylesterase [Parvibaculales bacterium]